MSPCGLIPFATVNRAPGPSIWVNFVGWLRSLAAFTGDEGKKPSASRIVVNVMFSFFICNFLVAWPFGAESSELVLAVHNVLRTIWSAVTRKIGIPRTVDLADANGFLMAPIAARVR